MDNPGLLLMEAWCSPTLKSPAGRSYSVLELAGMQSAAPVDICDPYLEEEKWDKEAMVLSTIAWQLEDEEDEDVECELAEDEEEATASPDADVAAFSGWAQRREPRGSPVMSMMRRSGTVHVPEQKCADPSCEEGCTKAMKSTGQLEAKEVSSELVCAYAHTSTPPGIASSSMAPLGAASMEPYGATSMEPYGATPMVSYGANSVSAKCSQLPKSGTAKERRDAHWKMASEEGHSTFECGCRVAKARGARSCLDQFGREQFRRWHNETYGVSLGKSAEHEFLDPATSIHHKMWHLKEPIALKGDASCDAYGRKWNIPTWKLDGHEVSVDLAHALKLAW